MSDIKKVIVTGVTGQDGSYMVEYLLSKTDHEVIGVVRRTANPNLSNLKNVINNQRFKIVVADLSDTTSIDNIVKQIKPDYFINLAAQSFVGASWQIPEQTFDVDAVGVLRCLEAIRKHAPFCRFYNAGSSEEFGDVETIPQNEKHPLRPRSPYGAAKAAARHIVKVYRESYNLYAVQGILFNHESERRGEEFVTRKITLGVARIAKALKEGKPFEPIELGNLDAKRDWSHAEDFIDGIWRMLNQEKYNRDLYLQVSEECAGIESYFPEKLPKYIKEYVLSSGVTYTIRQFVENAFRVANIDGLWYIKDRAPLSECFMIDDCETPIVTINPKFYRPAEVSLLLGDSLLAKEELDWTPKISFNELVDRMVKNDLAIINL